MKKATVFKIGDKEYSMSFNIRSLANMERSLGRSIFSIFAGTMQEMLEKMEIDVLAAAVANGIDGLGEEDPYDFMQRYFDDGGDYDTFAGLVLKAFIDTGLFMKGKAAKPKVAVKP